MKLPDFYHFIPFHHIKEKMGIPKDTYGTLEKTLKIESLTEAELEKLTSKDGLEISLNDLVVHDDGTLLYKNTRVILYIRDIPAYGAQKTNPKYHLANCRTLKDMREQKRFERYVVSTRTNGEFNVNIIRSSHVQNETMQLLVCQNCLTHLEFNKFSMNWAKNTRLEFVKNFNLDSFFEKYPVSLHAQKPKYDSLTAPLNIYNSDFSKVSEDLKIQLNWQCQDCGVILSEPNNRKWLHVHHKNGLKFDDSRENLNVLCIKCHANQPLHAHIKNLPDYKTYIDNEKVA